MKTAEIFLLLELNKPFQCRKAFLNTGKLAAGRVSKVYIHILFGNTYMCGNC